MREPQNTSDDSAQTLPPARQRFRSSLFKTVRVVLITYFAIVILLMFFEESLIFFPMRHPAGDWKPAGLDFDDVHFRADDGTDLHGWFCPVPEPRAVILMSHGNAGNITHRADEILLWQQHLNVSVFIYDYRGYGRSHGKPNERGLYSDARGAYRHLVDERKIAPGQIVLRGESIGSAVSLQLGLEVPHRALIMESPFTSAVDVGAMVYPWLPVRWLMRNRFESLERISGYRQPLLITHGTRDSIIPFEMGRRLFDAANEPKHFYAVEGADHNDVPFVGGPAYFEALRKFLDATETRAGDATQPERRE